MRFLTLTDGRAGDLSLPELHRAWKRLALKLRRAGKLREYLAVVETTERGALHLHVLCTGEFIAQKQLAVWAAAAGFGRVADVRAVRGVGERSAGGYLVKQLASYATKAKVEALAAKGAKRLRPVRCSRGWFPGGMAAAERDLVAAARAERGESFDPGPWWLIQMSREEFRDRLGLGSADARAEEDDEARAPPARRAEEDDEREAREALPRAA